MQETMSMRPLGGDRRVLVLALVLGAISAGLVVAFLASRDSSDPAVVANTSVREVVVATREIPVGTQIQTSMLEVRSLPVSAVISDAATSLEQVAGETARYPIAPGEQLSLLRLVEAPKSEALSFQIPDGMRGFTIPVNVSESPAGVLVPGDFVDVLYAGAARSDIETPRLLQLTQGDEEGDVEYRAAITLLQNVQVLSVQRNYVDNGVKYDSSVRGELPEDGGVSNITLALTPEQSQLMWLASQDGQMTLALRPFGDDSVAELEPISGPLSPQN